MQVGVVNEEVPAPVKVTVMVEMFTIEVLSLIVNVTS
jgi:hypothetical protein